MSESEDLAGQIADSLGITVFKPSIIGLFKIVLGADFRYGLNYNIQALGGECVCRFWLRSLI